MKTISDVSKELGLTLTGKTCGISFVVDCKFWETEYEGIYLTDYNLDWNGEMPEKDANLFKEEDLVALFDRKSGKRRNVSACMFEDTEFMKKEIKNFAEECQLIEKVNGKS